MGSADGSVEACIVKLVQRDLEDYFAVPTKELPKDMIKEETSEGRYNIGNA